MKSAPAKSPWDNSTRKRDSQYPAKREAVLKAAAALFRERGYDGTSLNELAEILNITKPTVYYYVQSKDDLILQIKWAAQDEVLAFMREGIAGPGKASDRLRAILMSYALFMTTDYGVCLALVPPRSMEPDSRGKIYARVEEANQIIYRLLQAGRKDGSLVFADPVVAAHTLFGSLNWMGSWYKADGRIGAREICEMQVDLLLEGVRARSESDTKPIKVAKKPARA